MLPVFYALLALLSPKAISAADANDQQIIRTNFVADAILKPDEMVSVIALAKSCGVSQVAGIETFHYLPSNTRGIRVISVERTNGRRVTFDTVEILRQGWTYKSKPEDPAKTRSNGEFWVAKDLRPTIHHELVTFSTPQGTIRVIVSPEITMNIADRIIKAFTTRRIKYAGDSIRGESDAADFARPTWLGKSATANVYEISFGSSPLVRYTFTLNGDTVRIVSVIHMYI